MKKILLAMMLFCAASVQAQEIYQEVTNLLDGYEKVKNDTLQNLEVRKIATFKWDAIYYMLIKASDSETEHELGAQVNAMIDFVNLFLARLKEAPKAKQEIVSATFKNASIENARYNDTDKEAVYAYVDHPDFLTHFSLDTDWLKALEAVKK